MLFVFCCQFFGQIFVKERRIQINASANSLNTTDELQVGMLYTGTVQTENKLFHYIYPTC